MDAAKVIEKILSDAEAEAQEIKKQADEKEQTEQAKLDEQLDEYKKQTEVLAQKAAEEEKAHMLAAARMKISKEYLAGKRKILDEVFTRAKKKVQNLPDDQYQQLMEKLLLNAAQGSEAEVVIDKNEKRIDQKFIEKVNHKLGNDKGKLRLSNEKQNITAGFILRSGKIKVNASIDVLLEQARKELEIELAKELFS